MMYNTYNPYNNPVEKIDNQIKELQNLRRTYQNMPQSQPIQNIINTNGSNVEFEARFTTETENPANTLVSRKTAFIDLKNGYLSIKEINGDITEYKIVLPKDEKDLKIEELERRLNELSTINKFSTTNEENDKSTKSINPRTTKDSK